MPLLALLCTLAPSAQGAANDAGIPRTILFVDDEDVLYRAGTKKIIEPLLKDPDNPVLFPSKPWEGMIGWTSVYRDPKSGKFQMWYQAYNAKRKDDPRLVCVVAYAESNDGRHWEKPNLGLFPYYETKETNIVLIGAPDAYSDRYCNSVLVDPHDPDPNRRYKMVYYDWAPRDDPEGAGMRIAFSPDGIHWNKVGGRTPSKTSYGAKGMQPPFAGESILHVETSPKGRVKKSWLVPISMSDAQDVIYDPLKGCYASYGKMWMQGPDGGIHWKHGMGRIESKDFVTWSKPQFLLGPNDNDPPELEFHTSPVFIYNNQYLSLNQILRRAAGTIDIELMCSRDGINWERPYAGEYILPRGTGPSFDSGSLITNATPIPMGDEIWFYYGAYRGTAIGGVGLDRQVMGSNDYFSGVGLAVMKKDRFVVIVPDPEMPILNNLKPTRETIGKEAPTLTKPNTIGQVTLKPVDLTAIREIKINANAKGGSVWVELLNERGYRVRGFSKDDAVAITKDDLAQPAKWRGASLDKLKPGRYMIRIHLNNARLYACTLE